MPAQQWITSGVAWSQARPKARSCSTWASAGRMWPSSGSTMSLTPMKRWRSGRCRRAGHHRVGVDEREHMLAPQRSTVSCRRDRGVTWMAGMAGVRRFVVSGSTSLGAFCAPRSKGWRCSIASYRARKRAFACSASRASSSARRSGGTTGRPKKRRASSCEKPARWVASRNAAARSAALASASRSFGESRGRPKRRWIAARMRFSTPL